MRSQTISKHLNLNLGALFVAVVFLFVAPVSSAAIRCSHLFREHQQPRSLTLIETELRHLAGDSSLLWKWLFDSGDSTENLAFVQKLNSLNKSQSQILLSKVHQWEKSKKTSGKWNARLLRMLLKDQDAWLSYIDFVMEYGDHGKTLTDALYQPLQSLPPHTKEILLKRVAELYPFAKKDSRAIKVSKWIRAEENDIFPPKRALDAIIRALIPAEKIIAESIDNRGTAQQGFAIYIEKMNKLFSGTSIGGYSAKQILLSLKVLQAELKKRKQDYLSDIMKNEIVVFGSFVNAKAKITTLSGQEPSDIDLLSAPHAPHAPEAHEKKEVMDINSSVMSLLSPDQLEHAIADSDRIERTLQRLEPDFQRQLANIFGQNFQLNFSFHSALDWNLNTGATLLNPVIFLVSEKQIRMVVYNPQNHLLLLTDEYPRPTKTRYTIYPLD